MPSRSVPVRELLQLLHSDTRVIAEDGPRPGETPESRAFIVALGAVYANADVQSTTDLLLNCPGGTAAQQARDPRIFARELWLDAWRHRDREIENAIVMIVDKILVDTDPDPRRSRALSRATFKLRPIDKPKTDDYANQISWTIPIKLGPPNVGQLGGEWHEATIACEAGIVPARSKHAGVTERWQDAVVRVVVVEKANGGRKIRHVLPLDHDRAIEIRAALAVSRAFVVFNSLITRSAS